MTTRVTHKYSYVVAFGKSPRPTTVGRPPFLFEVVVIDSFTSFDGFSVSSFSVMQQFTFNQSNLYQPSTCSLVRWLVVTTAVVQLGSIDLLIGLLSVRASVLGDTRMLLPINRLRWT